MTTEINYNVIPVYETPERKHFERRTRNEIATL
jgi:hypothetical protein